MTTESRAFPTCRAHTTRKRRANLTGNDGGTQRVQGHGCLELEGVDRRMLNIDVVTVNGLPPLQLRAV